LLGSLGSMSDRPPIPLYKDAETFKDVNYNMGQLVLILNHNITSMAKDMKWIKRVIIGTFLTFLTILVAAIIDATGWIGS